MRKLPLVTTLILLSAFAATFASAADDAPERISRQCSTSTPLINYPAFVFRNLGLHLDGRWVLEHGPELQKEFEPACAKLADCLENRDNPFMFCDDTFVLEIRPVCDRKFSREKQPEDWDLCKSFVEAYALDVDDGSFHVWQKAQAWSAAQPADPSPSLEVTIEPQRLVAGQNTKIVVTAIDTKTHVPVYALVKVGGKSFRSKANPAAVSSTLYPFDYTFAFDRVKNADGHFELVTPGITIEAPHYPPVHARFTADAPLLKATFRVARRRRVVVEAHDASTGAAVSGTVLAGTEEIGRTSAALAIGKGVMPELWVRADGYADTRAERQQAANKN